MNGHFLGNFHFWKLLFPGNLPELVPASAPSRLLFPVPERHRPDRWMSTRVILPPRGHLAMSGDIFGGHNVGRGLRRQLLASSA